jgi:hypothetical protein
VSNQREVGDILNDNYVNVAQHIPSPTSPMERQTQSVNEEEFVFRKVSTAEVRKKLRPSTPRRPLVLTTSHPSY